MREGDEYVNKTSRKSLNLIASKKLNKKNFSVLINSKKCVIARDTRPSGHMIVETVKAGLMQSGILWEIN